MCISFHALSNRIKKCKKKTEQRNKEAIEQQIENNHNKVQVQDRWVE